MLKNDSRLYIACHCQEGKVTLRENGVKKNYKWVEHQISVNPMDDKIMHIELNNGVGYLILYRLFNCARYYAKV